MCLYLGVGAIEVHLDKDTELCCHGAPAFVGGRDAATAHASLGIKCDERNKRNAGLRVRDHNGVLHVCAD